MHEQLHQRIFIALDTGYQRLSDHMTFNRLRKIVLLLSLACMGLPSSGHARVFGEAEWGYSRHTTETADFSSNESWYQRYALGYNSSGKLARGKLGTYSYTLGYEWADMNRRPSNSVQKGHLLYALELSGGVSGLPISYNVYSRDLSRMMTYNDAVDERFEGGRYDIVGEDTVAVSGGTRIMSGLSLDVGVRKNENYKAAPFLKELPRFVLEFTDDYVSDLQSTAPAHRRTSSYMGALGKGPLWLRYATTTYTNYLIPDENTELQQINIGTVDHHLQRTWVDVTNWIRLSADGQLSSQKSKGLTAGISPISGLTAADQYDLNLFAVATRDKWNARTFNTFSRTINRESGFAGHDINTPLYMEGVFGADSNWQARFVSRDAVNNFDRGATRTLLASFRVNTFKRSPFTLAPSLSYEKTLDRGVNTVNAEGRVETASTRRFSDRVGIFASYGVKYTSVQEAGVPDQTAYLQSLNGKIFYNVTDRLKVDFSQKLDMNIGTAESRTAETLQSNQYQQTSTSAIIRNNTTQNDYVRSVSALGAAWQPTARLRLAAQSSADIQKNADVPIDSIMSLSTSIDYVMPEYKLNARVQYSKRTFGTLDVSDWTAAASASYSPNRNLESSLNVMYTGNSDTSRESSLNAEVRQRLSYSVYKAGYGARKLLQLTEESSFLHGNGSNGAISTNYKTRRNLTLIANYYPFQRLFLGASARYSLLDPGSVNEYYYNATVGLQYTKLQATIDYAYGHRDGNDKRIESRFSANLKKQF